MTFHHMTFGLSSLPGILGTLNSFNRTIKFTYTYNATISFLDNIVYRSTNNQFSPNYIKEMQTINNTSISPSTSQGNRRSVFPMDYVLDVHDLAF